MIIHTYERTERGRACERYIKDAGARCREIYILPIPSTRDGIYLKDTDVPISDIVKASGEGVYIISYGIGDALKEEMRSRGAVVYDAALDEEFLEGNADLTALATLGVLLESEERVPRDLSFGVVGYGRIGKRLVRLLLFLESRVRVYTSSEKTRLELSEYGIDSVLSERGADLSGIDILINTAPAVIFDTGEEIGRASCRERV